LDAENFRDVYRQAAEEAGGKLVLVTTGPLSNVAAILAEHPDLRPLIHHVYVSGGAVWARGNAGDAVEFNFYRDPEAAAQVLSSDLPITVIPLDVTSLVRMDESHVARLAASGYRTGEALARMLEYPLEQSVDLGRGKASVHASLACGSVIWPNLFLKTRMHLDVETAGAEAGRCRPALGAGATSRVSLLTAVNAVDFLENVLESLCHEAFVV
jgi:inosine-uridine nucleoside N-ribohydrolase